ncbi:MAG: methionine--tRNA ligase [Nanoarchaeota archaeon]
MPKRFYITTPIYYINDIPTVGSSYTTIAADVIARWHRIKGEDVFFLTGLDENSQKTVQAAKKLCFDSVQKYADMMAEQWQKAWKILNISYDGFIRTTEQRHKDAVYKFFNKVNKKKDIYKGEYKGLYCDSCEGFLTEKELLNGLCPFHNTPPKYITEKNYFFKLSKYQKKILAHIENNPNFIQPESRRNEIINFIKEGLKDISISRPNLNWGIPLPIDQEQRIYVWFDALINYISGAEKYWPASIHLVGKDIIKFHCIIWPGMLLSADYKLPKQEFAHGFLTINGQKMGKSLGNAIDPIYLSNKYGTDAIRYYLMREIPFGQDGDFSEKALVNRINGELANELGNLLSRTVSMIDNYFKGTLLKGKIDRALQNELDLKLIDKYVEKLEMHHALDEIFKFIRAVNRYINEKQPWEIAKKDKKELRDILYNLADSLRIISILISPFMPSTSEKVNEQLGIKQGNLKDCKFGLLKRVNIKKGEVLFKKI